MKNMRLSFVALVSLLLGCSASAFEVEFNEKEWCTKTNGVLAEVYDYAGKIPAGWAYTNSNTNLKIDGIATPGEGIYALKYILSVQANSVGDLMMGSDFCIPRSEIVCDNIIGSLMLYVYPSYKNVDTFQLIATTNDWKNILIIGDPIPIRDDSYTKNGWMSLPVDDVLPGISEIAQSQDDFALRIGVRARAGGFSTTQGFLHSISIDFRARATPEKPFLVDCQTNELSEVINPGIEYGRMAVKVNVSPEDKICNLVVTGVLSRCNGETTVTVSNELEKIDGVYYEKMDDVTNRVPFDAGEIVTYSVFTKYQTTDPAISPLNAEGEFSEIVPYDVGKRGSVWINEIGITNGECLVELCGTTNRSYLSGWQIILSGDDKAYTNILSTAFDFTTNMVNGVVGIETCRWPALDKVDLEHATLELRNSAGVVEFSTTGVSIPGHYQMTGKAKWKGKTDDDWSYDWTGTATDGTFTFGLSDEPESFGHVNGGQGFLVPVETKLYFTTLIEGNGDPLPYASISATVGGILKGEVGTTNFVGQTDEETGTAEIGISGYSDDASNVLMTNSISAFAWKSENIVTNVSLYADIYLTNNVKPDVAYDDFSVLKDYWRSESAITLGTKTYYWGIANGVLQLESFNGQAGKDATLTSKSYMALRGKRHLDVSLDIWNTKVGVAANRIMIMVCFSDTPDFQGHVFETVGLANKNQEYSEGEKYTFRECVEMPQGFAQEGKVWIRVRALKEGASSSGVAKIDNLRIAALDSVKIDEFKMEEPTGASFPQEVPSDVELDITPLTGGIVSNFVEEVLVSVETNYVRKVAADLVLTINGAEFAVPFKFADGSQTNDVSAAEENVKLTIAPSTITQTTGGFLPGDEVQYYVRVTYDPDNAEDGVARDARYFPDNATATANGWRVENGYAPVVQSLGITDSPALTLVGKPETTTGGARFTVHGYSANGLSEVSIYVNGEKCAEQPFDYLSTNSQVRVMGEFAIETGLNASTTYTVTVKGKDGAGADLAEATFTFLTKPKMPDIEGAPEDGAYSPTKAFDFHALAEADDVVKLNFHWLLDETPVATPVVPTNYHDSVVNDGPHTVCVYVTDVESNVSPTNSLRWVVDTIKPTSPRIDGVPANGSVTNGVAYDLTAESEDATTIAYRWQMDGIEASTVTNFAGVVEPGFAFHEVKCYATDLAGNVSETNSWTWTVDTLAPTNLVISGNPANGLVTNVTAFRLVATAMDDMGLTYHWSLDGGDEVTTTDEAFEDEVADGYGRHEVTCYAMDEAGNVSVTNSWQWTVDTVAPTKPVVSGTPMNGSVTNEPNFHLSAEATDNTAITYHWLTNGVAAVSATNFEGQVTKEGEFVVSCYATDEANNVSETNSVSWIYDCTLPTVPVMSGVPADGAVTNGTGYGYSATAADAHLDAFYWSLDGADGVRALPGVKFEGNVAEGYAKHAVQVFATDTAGNRSAATNWTWTVDTKKPTDLKLTGLPISDEKIIVTNGVDFAFTAFAKDDMELTYHWKTNGVEVTGCTSSNYVGKVSEGTNTVSVYARDVVGNECDQVERTWVVDTHAPKKPSIDGTPVDGAITSDNTYSFSATSTDDTIITYHWALDDRTGSEQTFTGKDLADGDRAVFVYATDEAGNVSETNSWKWIVDTTAPTGLVISGTPANGSETNEPSFSLKAEAADATLITYHWLTNGVAAVQATNFVGKVEEEGLLEVKCYATDAAGNVSKTNTWSWTYDATSPTMPEFTAKPDEFVNETGYSITVASADDRSGIAGYFWSLNGEAFVAGGATKAGEVSAEGVYTVRVYSMDNAGNASATNSCSWTYDLTPPSEPAFTAKPDEFTPERRYSIAVSSEDAVSGVAGYFWSLNGGAFAAGTETYAGEAGADGEYTVRVYAVDGAGNASPTNTCSWTYDATSPSEPEFSAKPDKFTNEKAYSLTASSSDALSGVDLYYWSLNDGAFAEGTATYAGEAAAEGAYTVKVYAADKAGNVSATNTWSWTYDATPPSAPAFTAKPDEFVNDTSYTITVESTDTLSGIASYYWSLNDGEFVAGPATTNGEVAAEGVYTVRVYATDKAGNASPTNSCSWTYDLTPPSMPEFTAKPAAFTHEKNYSFVASSEDAVSGVSGYYWSLNGGAFAAGDATFGGETAAEGEYVVKVYATDGAGNVSLTNTCSWTYDATSPSEPEFSAKPDKFTNEKAYSLTASSSDALSGVDHYYWSLNDGAFAEGTATYAGEAAAEGAYTVKVYAADKAGNVSATNTWSWTYDATSPSAPAFTAKPDEFVSDTSYTITVESTDTLSGIASYYWSLNDGEFVAGPATTNGEVAAEGVYTVRVYATDKAGNASPTNTCSWTYDLTPPSMPELTAKPDAITNVKQYSLTASSEETVSGVAGYFWSLNGGAFAAGDATFAGEATAEGDYAVRVYAVDGAGNVSPTNTWSWTYDATPPSSPAFTAKPDEFVNDTGYTITVESTDDRTGLAGYFWSFDDGEFVAGPATTNGEVAAEAVYTVRVYATDKAGNASATNSCSWTYDLTPPSIPEFTAKPAAFTHEKNYSFVASSEDEVSGVSGYYWSLNGGAFAAGDATFGGETAAEGEYVVKVYATDGAGNVSLTNTWSWTYDKTSPTVVLSSDTPDYFNLASSPMKVTVEFSEFVTNFTAQSVEVENKEEVVVEPLGVATNRYTVTITPNGDGEVSVKVPAGVVADYAGNGNEASAELARIYDTKSPTVELTSSAPPKLCLADVPFEVTVRFDEPVTNFTENSVIVSNGTVQPVAVSTDPATTNKVFVLTINTPDVEVTAISVSIAAAAVTDLAGNPNEASNVLSRDCDVKIPVVAVMKKKNGQDAVQLKKSKFIVTVSISEPVTDFTAEQIAVQNGAAFVRERPVALQYSVEITPDADAGSATFQVEEGAVTDLAGNSNKATDKYVFSKDGSGNWSYVKE